MLDSRTFSALEKALEGATLRHKVIAHNIANVNTPGKKAHRVEFQGMLKEALAEKKLQAPSVNGSVPSALPEIVPRIYVEGKTSMKPGGNNIDLDKEMVLMAENQIYQETVVEQINRRLSMLKYIIGES